MTESRRRKLTSCVVSLLKISVAVLIVVWLVRHERLQLSCLRSVRLSWDFVALIALLISALAIPVLRWWLLLRAQKLHVGFGRVLAITWAGYFATLVLPGAASGDIAKSILILRQSPSARAKALSTVLVDRYLGLYSLLLLGMFALFWFATRGISGTAVSTLATVTITLLFSMTLFPVLLLMRTFRRLIRKVLPTTWYAAWQESLVYYIKAKELVFVCFCLSLASSAMTVVSFEVAGRMLDVDVPLSAAFLVVPLVTVANSLPIAPGGIGVAEAVSSEAFLGLKTARGAEIVVLLRILGAFLSLPGAITFLAQRRSKDPSILDDQRSSDGT